jgi:DNA repair and recombination protein RAD52
LAESARSKGAAFEKAKKEAATDAMKRTLRTFGNVLGNCFYDKEYLGKVSKIKVRPAKLDLDALHRHRDFIPIKEDPEAIQIKAEIEQKQSRSRTTDSATSLNAEFEDEFESNVFDGVELGDSREQSVQMAAMPLHAQSPLNHAQPVPGVLHSINSGHHAQRSAQSHHHQQHQSNQHQQQSSIQNKRQLQNSGPSTLGPNTSRNVQTPNQMQPPQRPQQILGQPARQSNQPIQNQGQPYVQHSPSDQRQPQHEQQQRLNNNEPGNPPVAFVTGRAAELIQKSDPSNPNIPINAPMFNPHAESPSLRRTSGFDHSKTTPVPRQAIPHNNNAIPTPQQPVATGVHNISEANNGATRTNFVNPHQDVNRRIGMPATAQSPLANRSAYKPPGPATGVKRPADAMTAGSGVPPNTTGASRQPLADVSNGTNNTSLMHTNEKDLKKIRTGPTTNDTSGPQAV